ncbi:Dehydrogenases with different specificities (related to short-chain alcohol dehydrogenases) [Rubrobacter radiotolerans]|uniref:3-oxoacyl-ACP reductase family protein n=1 Tax=Rubrobacter radiotolerans TaxID=42256 RepID=A0A023X0K9_RUBRA|nr:3-oxoacyl-ACP reductase family protein [Rubrobacter radiotolerans]AHY45883.1 Dehydrogenases with different specificities (related to short-chain alcohol dehydrogenases) [Rubrobacter radiotolerans]MDX5893296.1 3-oxoacyl-ACP reductase family protein [Rubrobacter radiotolerans]SMC03451.1 acetoacetyl-CoA reductase [Rubrobacter radiotolerans DSM 5868]
MGSLEGSVAVVTGAGRGLGAAIAKDLAAGGAKVVVNYSRSKEPAEGVVKEIESNGGEAVAVQGDVSDPEQAKSLIDQAVEQYGKIDVLVNNAGITIDKTMKKMTPEDWDKVITVDLNSCFYTFKAAMEHLIESSGRVINISSFVGQAGNFGQANYSAAKAGVIGFTKTAAKEMARSGVTVNAICPGFIETDMFADVPEKVVEERIIPMIPLGRIGQPEDVAKAVRYLVVDGDYITGQTLNVNGGVYI